ncbi:MAG: hypothetical protein LBF51_00990 [Zoogloeaceae bacterium]|jgi:hypothetical protein|nr:hypothetical protein [Zoogloeaceae bacterium]
MSVFSSRRSWYWLYATIRLFARRPFLFLATPMCFLLLALQVRRIPYFGSLLPQLLWLCLIAGMANLALSPHPSPMALVRSLWERLLPLAGLALLLSCYTFLALYLLARIDPEFIHTLLRRNSEPPLTEETQNLMPALRLILLFAPLVMAQWFTPLLIVWRRYSIGKALFCNFAVIGYNWRDILLVFMLFIALTLGVFFLFVPFFAVRANLVMPLLNFLWIVVLALHISLLCVLYRDFFPTEAPGRISEQA